MDRKIKLGTFTYYNENIKLVLLTTFGTLSFLYMA